MTLDAYFDGSEAYIYVDAEYTRAIDSATTIQFQSSIVLSRIGERPPECRLELLKISPGRLGIGVQFFARLVARLRSAGIQRVTLFAAGGPDEPYNGYYTWPAFGFDLALGEDLIEAAAAAGFPATSTHELLVRHGREGFGWWMRNGRGGEAAFELAENSTHSLILSEYLRRVGVHLD